jgi:hypothetical protein
MRHGRTMLISAGGVKAFRSAEIVRAARGRRIAQDQQRLS